MPLFEVDLDVAAGLLQTDTAVLWDVRTADECEITGVPEHAIHVPLACLQRFCGLEPEPHCEVFGNRDLLPEERMQITRELVTHAARGKALLIICRSGQRSLAAAKLIRELGFQDCFSVRGGVLAWTDAGLPMRPFETHAQAAA